ncbi:hypothetical protein ONZ51_g3856 [Trametes cubensis]|uniref:Uncharacterized protein n=1 Tax=Trametes cubensis TaxID=1111947 RepID=A0AAD7TXI6_9APHY|nr:hypothetical protein ONZ51_g3856 [Trametes cubensis]
MPLAAPPRQPGRLQDTKRTQFQIEYRDDAAMRGVVARISPATHSPPYPRPCTPTSTSSTDEADAGASALNSALVPLCLPWRPPILPCHALAATCTPCMRPPGVSKRREDGRECTRCSVQTVAAPP